MTDRKTNNRRRPRRGGKARSGQASPAKNFQKWDIAANGLTTTYRATIAPILLNSGTTGTLASASIGFSIAQVSEYSLLTGLYSGVRLVAARLVFVNKTQTLSGTLQDTVMVGSRPDYNITTPPSTPTGFQFVENLSDMKTFGTYGVRMFTFYPKIPKDLEYTPLTADAPVLPTEFAGSPGSVLIYATNLSTSSVNYFSVTLSCVWQLKRRV
jgi:hypothetical protein